MRVVYKPERRVVVLSKNHIKVIDVAVQGPDAIPPETYAAHMTNTNNPHEVGLLQLVVPSGNAGQWVRISDDGTTLIVVDPPLTEMPILPQPIDEKVKADPHDATGGYLNEKVSGIIYVDESAHVLRLLGVTGTTFPGNYYYGTNDNGQLGFWPLPNSLLQMCGITEEIIEEWLDDGAVAFYDWP